MGIEGKEKRKKKKAQSKDPTNLDFSVWETCLTIFVLYFYDDKPSGQTPKNHSCNVS